MVHGFNEVSHRFQKLNHILYHDFIDTFSLLTHNISFARPPVSSFAGKAIFWKWISHVWTFYLYYKITLFYFYCLTDITAANNLWMSITCTHIYFWFTYHNTRKSIHKITSEVVRNHRFTFNMAAKFPGPKGAGSRCYGESKIY